MEVRQTIHVEIDTGSEHATEDLESQNGNLARTSKPFSTHVLYWFLLFVSISFYGVGIFIVFIPEKILTNIEDVPQNAWFLVSIGRVIGTALLIVMTTKLSERKHLVEWFKRREYRFSIWTSFLSCFFNVLGYVTYEFLILRGNSLGLMSVITDSFVLFTVLYGIFVFKDPMNNFKWLGFLIFAIALVLIGFGKVREENGNIMSEEQHGNSTQLIENDKPFDGIDILLIFVTMTSWTGAAIVQITALKKIPYSFFLYVLLLGQVANTLMGTIWFFAGNFVFNLESLIIFIGYFMTMIANMAGTYLSADDHTAKWNALIHLNTLITLGLSMAFFGERLNSWLYAGIGCLIGSSVLISI